MDSKEEKPQDAGMRSLYHYQRCLPSWRLALREALLPVVRWETPHLARLQQTLRSPALDTYFALTANLGTHTFFMIILPMLWWCGQEKLGRAMVHILASGVYFSGFIKDLLCLPRPLSPPLQRISRSASAALEYGFPSTHSTNAVSVAIYAIYAFRTTSSLPDSFLGIAVQAGFCFYAISIVAGRVYCGMHGFFDIIVGSLLGACIAFFQIFFGQAFDELIIGGSFKIAFLSILVVLVLVRIHPEPADDCPCYDDSVAFSGVMIGTQLGGWHFAQTGYASMGFFSADPNFIFQQLGGIKVLLRTFLGVAVIFAWRGVMKPTLLKLLPPFFRFIESFGLTLPRRFHLRASEYDTVPPLRKDDGVIPSASEIPAMITSLRHPRRRTVSVGPQSQADAFEAIALRERRRRESATSASSARGTSPMNGPVSLKGDHKHSSSDTEPFPLLDQSIAIDDSYDEQAISDQELFQKLQIPRVRYDVEVVTKLIVYTGIAWLAVEWNLVLFERVGLGFGVRQS